MASVPFGMHAAQKVRHDMELASKKSEKNNQNKSWDNKKKSENWKDILGNNPATKKNSFYGDLQLSKYSEKMMNSIWGLYNRYSVHNLKSITAEDQARVYGNYGFASFASFLNEVQYPSNLKKGNF